MSPQSKTNSSKLPHPHELWNDLLATRSHIDELLVQARQTGDLRGAQAALEELQLKTATYEGLLREVQAPIRAVLGRNFLGVEEWRQGFDVHVGPLPVIPEYINSDLLNSPCPLQPGELIKDTHILMLLPKTVNGKPYSALELSGLCNTRRGSGAPLLDSTDPWSNWWMRELWAMEQPAESAWVLIPTSDPPFWNAPEDKHFRRKDIFRQEKVYEDHYLQDYRPARAVEIMTAAILNDVVNGGPRMLKPNLILIDVNRNHLRCSEPTAAGGYVSVGNFDYSGLCVSSRFDADCSVGFALARKPRS